MYTINDPINRARTLHSARLGVVHGDTRRTYGELAERIDRVGALLRDITAPGDRVALWSLNSTSSSNCSWGCRAPGVCWFRTTRGGPNRS